MTNIGINDNNEDKNSVISNLLPSLSESKPSIGYIKRYYNHYILQNLRNIPGNNYRILQHSNNLCILCIDPSNFLLSSKNYKILSLSFGSKSYQKKFPNHDFFSAPTGKRKKDAIFCESDMTLLRIGYQQYETQDKTNTFSNTIISDTNTIENELAVPACIPGYLLELNARIFDSPQLVLESPLSDGFLAIISPHDKFDSEKLTCISRINKDDSFIEDE